MTTARRSALEPFTRRPLALARNRVYRVWRGGALLDRMQGTPDPEDANFPEEWAGSTTVTRLPGRPADEGLSRVLLPDGSTVFLKKLIEAFPDLVLGTAHAARYGAELGVLCKLLDAGMRLSIQAHPDRAFARQHLQSEFGKTESWLIIGTREINGERPSILFGFRDGVTEEEFRRITRAQDTQKQVEALNCLEVQPGEVYLVPAGTPHAIGSGVFVVEVQEPTDYVVNAEYVLGEVRRTEAQCFMGLGFDLGMRCFNYQAVGMDFVQRHTLAPRVLYEDVQGREDILLGPEDTSCFGAARLRVRGAVPDRDRGRCYVGLVIEGRGHLVGPDIDVPLRAGETFFVPAASRHEAFQATAEFPMTLIKCFPPVP